MHPARTILRQQEERTVWPEAQGCVLSLPQVPVLLGGTAHYPAPAPSPTGSAPLPFPAQLPEAWGLALAANCGRQRLGESPPYLVLHHPDPKLP